MGRSSIGNDRWLTCGVEGALLDIECEIDTGDATAVTLRCEGPLRATRGLDTTPLSMLLGWVFSDLKRVVFGSTIVVEIKSG